jgi:hypothetical protein
MVAVVVWVCQGLFPKDLGVMPILLNKCPMASFLVLAPMAFKAIVILCATGQRFIRNIEKKSHGHKTNEQDHSHLDSFHNVGADNKLARQ